VDYSLRSAFGNAGAVLTLCHESCYDDIVDVRAHAQEEERHCIACGFVRSIQQAHAAVTVQQSDSSIIVNLS